MVFQPISPIRGFQKRFALSGRRNQESATTDTKGNSDTATEDASCSVEEDQSRDTPAPSSAASSLETDKNQASRASDPSSPSADPTSSLKGKETVRVVGSSDEAAPCEKLQPQPQHRGEPSVHNDPGHTRHAHFSDMDTLDSEGLAPLPKSSGFRRTSKRSSRVVTAAGQSFFETSSDSEGDDAFVGRASSVRVSRPSMIQYSSSLRGRVAQIGAADVRNIEHSTASLGDLISECSENTMAADDQNQHEEKRGGPHDSLDLLEGTLAADAVAPTPGGQDARLTLKEGLRMNPVTDGDKVSISRAMSAPVFRRKGSSSRRVTIRPSDLVITRPKDDTRTFRETIVMTPYPALNETEEMDAGKESGHVSVATSQPQRSSTLRSVKVGSDRFPSPDQPEILFLDLGLARHPEMTAGLEITIADKSVFDDEMLFRQIRNAYKTRLLGTSRRPFSLVRRVAYATVSAFVQQDFRMPEFMRHFHHPQIGRRRKSWVIWLRHHSRRWQQQQQLSPYSSDGFGVVKSPLSASLRSADRRLSAQSDSTSIFSFPFLSQFSILRLPFFNKDSASPPSVPPSRSPLRPDADGSSNVIRIDLYHEFSFWVLAFLFLWTAFLSTAATVLWVVFGVPGLKPGGTQARVAIWSLPHTARPSWRTDAEDRVLTGLVLGLLVAVIGSMGDVCLVTGAYLLL